MAKRKTKTVAQINKALRKKLDKIFSLVIRKRDGVCQWCGATGKLDCSHNKDRRNLGTRWDMANAIALCPRCHRFGLKSWHNDPIGAADWFAKKFPARAEYLRQAVLDRNWRTDELRNLLDFLTQKLSELDAK